MIDLNTIKVDVKKYIIETSLSEANSITDDTLIFDNGLLDSMGLLFLIEFLNENYKIEVNDEELNPENFESINSIVSFIQNKIQLN